MWNLKKANSWKHRVESWLPRPGGWGNEMGDVGQKAQTSLIR